MTKTESRQLSVVSFLSPLGSPGVELEAYTPRLGLANKAPVIGLFSNGYVDAVPFLDDVAAALSKLLPNATFRRYDKGFMHYASFAATPEFIETIRSECDAVVLAYGHCGSCTAGLARDTVALARAGVPVASLITRKFIEEADFVAMAAGIPDVPYVHIPYPIAGEPAAYHRKIADLTAPEVLNALRTGARGTVSDLPGPSATGRAA